MENIELLWLLVTIPCLLWASYKDIKDRLIPDTVWIIQLVLGLVLLIYWIPNLDSTESLIVWMNIIFGLIFAIVFFIAGAFGGADSKALIVLAISSPIGFSFTYFENTDNSNYFPSILFILTNMMVLFIVFALILCFRNLLERSKFGPLFEGTTGSTLQKLNLLFSSYRVLASELGTMKHYDPMEKWIDEEWSLYTPIFEGPIDDEEWERRERIAREQAIEDTKNTEKTWIWIRPQPPGLVFITIAYLFWVIIGSPLILFFPFVI